MKKYLLSILCLLPLGAALIYFLASKTNTNLASLGILLICPLTHILFMGHQHKDGVSNHKHDKSQGGENI